MQDSRAPCRQPQYHRPAQAPVRHQERSPLAQPGADLVRDVGEDVALGERSRLGVTDTQPGDAVVQEPAARLERCRQPLRVHVDPAGAHVLDHADARDRVERRLIERAVVRDPDLDLFPKAELGDPAARQGGLRPEQIAGGAFAISNMGMYGVSNFTAIITPPNGAALAVGKVEERPVVRDGQIRVAQMMSATISADHRAVNGACWAGLRTQPLPAARAGIASVIAIDSG